MDGDDAFVVDQDAVEEVGEELLARFVGLLLLPEACEVL